MMPPPPGRFSTTKDWPSCPCSALASVRLRMSEAPAGGEDEISRTSRVGHGACARAGRTASVTKPAMNGATGRRHGVTSRSLHVASPSESTMHQARSGPAPSDMTAMPIALAAAIDLVMLWVVSGLPTIAVAGGALEPRFAGCCRPERPDPKGREPAGRGQADDRSARPGEGAEMRSRRLYRARAHDVLPALVHDRPGGDRRLVRARDAQPGDAPAVREGGGVQDRDIVRLCRAHARGAGGSIRQS